MVSAGEVEIGVASEWHADSAQLRVIPLEHWRLVVAALAGDALMETPEITL